MKKLVFFFCILLGLVSCICDEREEVFCHITTEYNSSEVTVTPSDTTVLKGKIVELSYEPQKGFVVYKITKNGVDIDIPTDNTVRYITEEDAHILFFTEKLVEYSTVNISTHLGCSVSPSGLNKIEKGKDLYVQVTANEGYFIDSIYFDGVGQKLPRFTEEYIYHYTVEDTLSHELFATSREKETYTLIVQVDTLTNCTHSGTFSVLEGDNFEIKWSPKQFCSVKSQTLDGKPITSGLSYIWEKMDNDHVIVITAQKNPEWYLVNIKWKLSYLNIGGTEYVPYNEVFDFLSNGTCKRYWNDEYDGYTLNWGKNNDSITFNYAGPYQIATIDKVDNEILIFHYSSTIKACKNIGYQN